MFNAANYYEIMRQFAQKYSEVVPRADIVDIIESKSRFGCSEYSHHFFKGRIVGFFSSLSASNNDASELCSDIISTIDTLISIIKTVRKEQDAQKQ